VSGSVSAAQRFTARQPCPVCGGHARLPSGHGARCYGFLSADERYAHCTRDEHAHGLLQENGGSYAHRLHGDCKCGQRHGGEPPATNGHKPELPPRPVVRTRRWRHMIVDGEPIEHVRVDYDGGGKRVWWQRGGENGLRGYPVSDLPLYGADQIGDAKGVIIVEGEPARDALDPLARELGLAVVATVTGAKTRPSDDVLRTLPAVPLYLWPDSDDDGESHMTGNAGALVAMGRDRSEIRRLVWPAARPGEGDDAADFVQAGATADDLGRLDTPPFLSAAPREGVAAERNLLFRSARDIAAATPEVAAFAAEPWLPEAGLLEIDGKIKSSGKTTFATHMCRAILDARDFMGRPTRRSPIVYLSEQSPASFREALRRADLLDRDDFSALLWHDTIGTPWPAIVRAARAEAARIGARVLVVDTLGQFAGVKGDAENNAGAALEAVAPLQEAAAVDGLAVAILRHERKGGGEVGDSGRGSSAFAGAVDVVLRLRRPEGAARPGVRVLESLSRFDQTPDTLVIELTDAGYVALGDTEAVAAEEARTAVLMAAPSNEDDAMREADLLLAADVKRTVGQGAIREHLDAGRLCRTGEGKRGDPFRYWRPADGEMLSAAYREEAPAESIFARGPDRDPDAENVSAATQGAPAESNGHNAETSEKVSAGTPTVRAAERNNGSPLPADCPQPAVCAQFGACLSAREGGSCPPLLARQESLA
jgi:hypothetical protein